jgi:hypothetical protein
MELFYTKCSVLKNFIATTYAGLEGTSLNGLSSNDMRKYLKQQLDQWVIGTTKLAQANVDLT